MKILGWIVLIIAAITINPITYAFKIYIWAKEEILDYLRRRV